VRVLWRGRSCGNVSRYILYTMIVDRAFNPFTCYTNQTSPADNIIKRYLTISWRRQRRPTATLLQTHTVDAQLHSQEENNLRLHAFCIRDDFFISCQLDRTSERPFRFLYNIYHAQLSVKQNILYLYPISWIVNNLALNSLIVLQNL